MSSPFCFGDAFSGDGLVVIEVAREVGVALMRFDEA